LRAHHARDAAERAGDLPIDVTETALAPAAAFRGGLLFTPPGCATDTIIVYFHGGGFLAGSPETHRCVTAWLAKLSGMRVLSARYGLAPERAYPAQQEDAIAACEMACTLSGGLDRTQLFLAGDSAGACVALWAWRGFRPPQRRIVKGLVLLYGGFGHVDSDSIAKYGTPENGLDAETLSIMYRRLGTRAAEAIWPKDFAAEITAPAYVLAASLDAVFDDSAKLFQALPGNTANKTFVVVEGQDHGFFKGTGKDPVAFRELANAAHWIARIAGSKA
jgi:acetyl esterase